MEDMIICTGVSKTEVMILERMTPYKKWIEIGRGSRKEIVEMRKMEIEEDRSGSRIPRKLRIRKV